MKSSLLHKPFFAYLIIQLFINYSYSETNCWKLISPDHKICVQVQLEKAVENNKKLVYMVDRIQDGKPVSVIEKSTLGIIREDQQFVDNLSFLSKSKVKTIDERYEMKIGRQVNIRNHGNELMLTFKNEKGSLIQLVFRAYNDGIAFKYVFPEKSDKLFTVTQELSSFKIPTTGKCWIQPYDIPTKWTPGYELYYQNEIPIGTNSPNVEGWAFPALFHYNDIWALISEANLSPNYCGSRLGQNAPNGLYKLRFPDPRDGESTGVVNPSSTLPWEMPWRTIIIGSSLSTIYESQLINNVCDKQIGGDFSWVKTGRASWSWITDPPSSKNYNSLKEFVDLAYEMNWEYSLVDANWETMEGGSIEQLVKYASSKNIGILMWYNSGGPNNIISEGPRDIICDAQRRKAEFKKLHEWGVKGVKIDFWQSDKQNMISLYHDVLKDAAENHILVNLHGCSIPRGWSRTYPNLVSTEAVKGEECYLFDSTYVDNAPIQNTILPFSRNVIGPMDYTPLGLKNLKFAHKTSVTHELALSLIFNTGIVHFSTDIESCQALPTFVKDFLKIVPVTFDETHLVSGYPGKDVIIALRKGKDWYISGINGEEASKSNKIALPYIKGNYTVNFIADGTDNKSFANKNFTFKTGNSLDYSMNGFGGFVVKMTLK